MSSSVAEAARLSGSLSATASIHGALAARETITGKLEYDASAPAYRGPYQVRPSASGETLETSGMRMTDDVEVEPIPFARVGNESDGYTVTIG